MGNLRQIGKTGVMLNKNIKDVKDPALKEALKKILGDLKAKNEKPNKKKKKKKMTIT
jgi:hypothetical protein